MPSLMVCALLGLAVAVLLDVLRAPGPAARRVETPALIVGLARLRQVGPLPRPSRRPRATPTFFIELADVSGEIESPEERAAAADDSTPTVIVEL